MSTEQSATAAWPSSSDFEDVTQYWDLYVARRDALIGVGREVTIVGLGGHLLSGLAHSEEEWSRGARLITLDQALRAEDLISQGYVDYVNTGLDEARMDVAVVPRGRPTYFLPDQRIISGRGSSKVEDSDMVVFAEGPIPGPSRVLVRAPQQPDSPEDVAARNLTREERVGKIRALQGAREWDEIQHLQGLVRDARRREARAKGFHGLPDNLAPDRYSYSEVYITSLDGDSLTLGGGVLVDTTQPLTVVVNRLCRVEVTPCQMIFVKP